MSVNKILVTGAGGFIGSHLAERLTELGYSVRAFVRYNSNSNWGWLEQSSYLKDMEIYSGDIRDYDSVRNAMEYHILTNHHWHILRQISKAPIMY